MKETVLIIIGSCVCAFGIIFISNAVPDSFRHGGIYFDKYPIWMNFVFIVGIIAISAFAAFIIGSAIYSVLECKEIKIWIKERLQRYKNRNRYKFHDATNEFKRTIKY